MGSSDQKRSQANGRSFVLKAMLVIFDIIAVNLAYFAALTIRFYVNYEFNEWALVYGCIRTGTNIHLCTGNPNRYCYPIHTIHPLRRDLSEPSFLLLPCHFKQTLLPSVICLLTNTSFLAPVFYRPPTAPACIDSFCPQCQFFLFVERLQLSCHENTPVSRIVSASCKYYLLLYGSIVTYCECGCKSWGGLTLTLEPRWKYSSSKR